MLVEAAIAAINEEIEKDCNNANLFKERGRLRFQLGDETGAMQDLRNAIALDPSLVNQIANGSFQSKIGSCH